MRGWGSTHIGPRKISTRGGACLQHDHGLLTYQDYVGAVAQHVAVDTEAAAAAIARLAGDPSLRKRMGEAGRQTVQQRFDWPVVARLHSSLCRIG